MLFIAVSSFILAAHADFLGLGFNSAFAIGPMQVGRYLTAVPVTAAQAILVSAFVLFVFVANPDRKIWLRPLAALWDFYQFSTGLLGDFLSYIRLFALALAGGLLGNAFNQIAFMLLPKTPTGLDLASPWLVGAILILIFGHGLNFALGVLGADRRCWV
jgi:V/A-type H+-transporting ATPase subunit I